MAATLEAVPITKTAKSLTEKSEAEAAPELVRMAKEQGLSLRAVPGHWERDLIIGSTASKPAIGTLVERASGYVMLLHLPGDHAARTVADAIITAMNSLPEQLRPSTTWDQGAEMSRHQEITMATGMPIYFCDPHSPLQRGSNENTNGLLREYFPKSTDLSFHWPGILENVAAELNRRPRKRHGSWLTCIV